MRIPTASFFLATLLFFTVPDAARAASLSFDTLPGVVSVGDTVVVRGYLDPSGDSLNALDGAITTVGSTASFSITEINLAGSALTVWPQRPLLSTDQKTFVFTGGTPGVIPPRALLFTMVIKADSPGTIVVDAASATGYKNDGKGTPVAVLHTPLTFSIGAAVPGTSVRNQWTELVGRDTTPPEPFSLSLGSDPSVFDGKTFVSFQTTDAQSGVAYYEVKEGERAPVRTESPYVLYEQTKPVRVIVYAYDASGNVQTATYTPTSGTSYLYWIIGALLLLIILGVWRWYRKTL